MTPILTRASQSRGFTLIEIIISLGIIATALLAVFRLQAQNLDLQAEARFITTANQLAQDRISRIGASGNLNAGTSSGDFGENFPDFFFREEIIEVPDLENLFKVKVSIILKRAHGVRNLSVETYLYGYSG